MRYFISFPRKEMKIDYKLYSQQDFEFGLLSSLTSKKGTLSQKSDALSPGKTDCAECKS